MTLNQKILSIFSVGFLLLVVGVLGLLFSPLSTRILSKVERIIHGPPPPKEIVVEKVVERIVEKEVVREPNRTFNPKITKDHHIGKLYNGISIKTESTFEQGKSSAVERKEDDSMQVHLSFRVKEPQAASTLIELEQQNSKLREILPGLSQLLEKSKVSPFYEVLYSNKKKRMQKNVKELAKLLSRHNYYDCETILEAEFPETGQKVFIVQAEMDVVADGSDGDRLTEMPDEIVNSTHYQPFTSYWWPKQTDRPNPMIVGWEQRIKNADAELANPNTTQTRSNWLKKRKKYLRSGIENMQKSSFLVAEHDPFVVMPTNMILDRKNPYAPKAGDYGVVIYKEKIYPVIVGDAGPDFKVGEGSVRLAKELNPKATPYYRPVSDLTVTYLVFPGSREKKRRPPDYQYWQEQINGLLLKIGGLGEEYSLYQWESTFPPIVEEAPKENIDDDITEDITIDEAGATNKGVSP